MSARKTASAPPNARELGREAARPRVQVRLEGGAAPPPRERAARRRHGRLDLGRMVRVVVHDVHATGRAEPLEAALDAAEPLEPRPHVA